MALKNVYIDIYIRLPRFKIHDVKKYFKMRCVMEDHAARFL